MDRYGRSNDALQQIIQVGTRGLVARRGRSPRIGRVERVHERSLNNPGNQELILDGRRCTPHVTRSDGLHWTSMDRHSLLKEWK